MTPELEARRDALVLAASRAARDGGHELGMFQELDETGTRLSARCPKCGGEVVILVLENHAWGPPVYAGCLEEEPCPTHGIACPEGPLFKK